jgi:hypothetical protein
MKYADKEVIHQFLHVILCSPHCREKCRSSGSMLIGRIARNRLLYCEEDTCGCPK